MATSDKPGSMHRSHAAPRRHPARLLLTLIIGLSGAVLAFQAGLPAAALLGSSLAVAGAALAKLTTDVPLTLRNLAFLLIGCSLGSGITPEALGQAVRWPVSLASLALTIALIMWSCCRLLTRFFGHSLATAALATSPGALVYSLALAAGGIGDARTIVVIQSIRLLLITTLLPFILGLLDLHTGRTLPAAVPAMSGLQLLMLALPATAVGWAITKLKIPASYLLAGILASGAGHYFGLLHGRPPSEILFLGFTITGTVIGARFSTIPIDDLRRLLGASLLVLLLSIGISGGCAFATAMFLELPYGQVFVAFAPGGVEAMAVMAIALGYDPTYVTVHHLFRIFLLMAVLPLIFKTGHHRTSGKKPGGP